MADIDTGLGWYADQDWLSAAAGAIGSLSTGGEFAGFVLTYSAPITVAKTDGTPNKLTITNNQDTVYFGVQYYGSGSIRVCCLSLAPFSATLDGWGTANGQQNYGGSGDYYCTLQRYTPASTWEWYYPYPNNKLPGDTADTAVRNMLAGLGVLFPEQPISVGETITPYRPEYPMTYTGYYMPNVTPPPGGPKLYFFATTSPSAVYIAWVRDNDEPHNPPIEMHIRRSDGVNYSILLGYQAGYPGISYGTLETGSVQEWLVPVFDSVFDALDALSNASPAGVTVDFNKSTAGYSVVCMCKWITSYGGDVYCSPVLISSEPNNTLYTRNSATPPVNNTEHQYQGKTFYMRKAPFDTFTEGAEITSSFPLVDLSGVAQTNDTIFLAIAYQSNLTVGQVDPYSGAGESEPGAEEATFDFDSTEIDFGTPPTVTAAGMVELYIPSTSDLASLAQYLWAGSFDPDNFKKLFADPMDAIIGLQIVPVTATEIGTTPDTLYVGNISTGLSMPKASRQYVPVDCGSLSIPRRLGSYLDYSPHTEMQLYLPYIGFVDISPDDCMGGTVSVKYLVDIIGGTCVAQVKCNDHVLYEYAAACSCQVPVSAGQYQNIVLGAVRGGIGLVSGILGAAGGGLFSGLSEAADAAMSMTKPKIQRSGGFGGSSGLMGHQTPYIIYTVPRLIVPGRQNNFIGYPSYITRTLGDLTGYTQIDSIHLTGIPASQSEQAEIEQLLQEGVYL